MAQRIVVCDFEFAEDKFGFPVVRCVAFCDLTTGRQGASWVDALVSIPSAFTGDYVMVAFAAKAELSCFQVLGWPFPPQVLDLFFLYKRVINGDPGNKGSGLFSALSSYGIKYGYTEAQKHHFQTLAARTSTINTPSRKRRISRPIAMRTYERRPSCISPWRKRGCPGTPTIGASMPKPKRRWNWRGYRLTGKSTSVFGTTKSSFRWTLSINC